MINENFKTTLIKIAKVFKKNNIDWILIGTTTHDLQGMERQPNDIDIVVRLRELRKIRDLFSDYNPSKINQLRPGHSSIELKIKGVPVEIIGQKEAHDFFTNKEDYITTKEINGTIIPCRKLEKEVEFYKKLGREKRVKELQNFLN